MRIGLLYSIVSAVWAIYCDNGIGSAFHRFDVGEAIKDKVDLLAIIVQLLTIDGLNVNQCIVRELQDV